ncbi:hypothetical protein [Paenibacillus humicola]|uniref:hypothetical protein n=1 Tax=Paenibacillus humicola TaxID=3110540 RepID=UPI00237A3B8A|nr:hypothetical protein [Paenibacillus humicola]
MLVPVESKQIAYCSYNERERTLHLYYHTGEVVACPSVKKSDFESALESPNRYDALMKVAQQKGHVAQSDAEAPVQLGDAAWPDH